MAWPRRSKASDSGTSGMSDSGTSGSDATGFVTVVGPGGGGTDGATPDPATPDPVGAPDVVVLDELSRVFGKTATGR